jgi:hypothetical protein
MLSRYSFFAFSVALQFVPQPCIVLCSSLLTVLHFLYSSILLFISYVISGFHAFLSTLPTKSLIVFNTHFFILFYCTAKFPLSHSVTLSFSCRVSCTFGHWVYNFSKSRLDFRFWKFMIFIKFIVIFFHPHVKYYLL